MTDQLLTPADELAGGFRGELVQPGDEGYVEARAVGTGSSIGARRWSHAAREWPT